MKFAGNLFHCVLIKVFPIKELWPLFQETIALINFKKMYAGHTPTFETYRHTHLHREYYLNNVLHQTIRTRYENVFNIYVAAHNSAATKILLITPFKNYIIFLQQVKIVYTWPPNFLSLILSSRIYHAPAFKETQSIVLKWRNRLWKFQ